MKRLSLILKRRYLIIDHIHKYEPGFIVLRAFICKCKTSLLGKRFLWHVLRIFKSLVFHTYVIQECSIAPSVSDEKFLHLTDAGSSNFSESFSPCKLMQHFQGRY